MQQLKNFIKNRYRYVLFSAALVLIAGAASLLIMYQFKNNKEPALSQALPYSPNNFLLSQISSDNSKPYNTHDFVENIRAGLEENSDTVGWIQIKNTNIDFLVLQNKRLLKRNNGSYNDYYLKLNTAEKYDYNGSIFADYRNTFGATSDSFSKNTIIYGHTFYSNRNKKFGQLERYKKLDFAKKNQYIEFATPFHLYHFKIFAAFLTDTDFYYINEAPDDKEFTNLIEGAKMRSKFIFDTNVTADDKIITLSTCTYEYGMNTNVRWVIMGKLMDEGQDLSLSEVRLNPNPKRPQVRK